ncbi:MAG TPA: hypothetical protein VF175_01435, partial [Lacipirellula sp.]
MQDVVSANFDERASCLRRARPRGAALRAAAIFLIAALLGYWWRPADESGSPHKKISDANAPSYGNLALSEQIQEILAKGGCPGWIALANEP